MRPHLNIVIKEKRKLEEKDKYIYIYMLEYIFTIGCFDKFHKGHIKLLESMKKKTLYPQAKDVKKRYNLSKKYFHFLKMRTKKKTFKERKSMRFNYR
jgi:FAD synthase